MTCSIDLYLKALIFDDHWDHEGVLYGFSLLHLVLKTFTPFSRSLNLMTEKVMWDIFETTDFQSKLCRMAFI